MKVSDVNVFKTIDFNFVSKHQNFNFIRYLHLILLQEKILFSAQNKNCVQEKRTNQSEQKNILVYPVKKSLLL